MWLSWNEVFRWRQTLARPSVGRNKNRFSSDQWTRLHVRIVHPKWSYDQSNRAWRSRNVNCGPFMGRRAHIPWWWRRLITVRVLMWPPNAKLPRSAPAVLNGHCLARLDMSRCYILIFPHTHFSPRKNEYILSFSPRKMSIDWDFPPRDMSIYGSFHPVVQVCANTYSFFPPY
jgi:hypothetical protein